VDPRRARGLTARLAAVFLAGALACAVNPVTGQRELVLVSPAQEAAQGRQAAEQVAAQIGLVDDPQLSGYVQALGERLARHSPRRDVAYRFAVADMAEPNAFALPGGYIYVSRGLLAIANSEDELANVIGHEIAHVAARHSAQRQTRAVGVGLLSVLGTVAAGALGGAGAAQVAAQVGQVAGAGLIASYGRDQEREADAVGQQLSAAAGFDPMAMASFLSTLEQHSRLRAEGQERRPSFLDSHPMTAERAQATAERARTLAVAPAAPIAAGREAFLSRVDGMLLGDNPAEGVFQAERFLHPDLDFALAFPRGWRTENGKSAVVAGAPEGDALLIVEIQEAPTDPARAAARFAQENRIELQDTRRLRIGGYDAFRAYAVASSSEGNLVLHLTFIQHPRGTFRLLGLAPQARFGARAGGFDAAAGSFRALTRSEREGISEKRLRMVRARAGETLRALSARTGNAWSPAETAVHNALIEGIVLQEGELVKIAVSVPYRGARP
jgi:predicted Zn-dependent protease